jgi:hypothetical protein
VAADVDQVLHPEARAELREAVIWYREHTGDAMGFVAEVTRTVEELSRAPQRWPILRNVTSLVRYRVVLAVAHQKRQPLYWFHRA